MPWAGQARGYVIAFFVITTIVAGVPGVPGPRPSMRTGDKAGAGW
ncbi:MAG: hypothetical protein QOK42_2482 [Frankiaceae bacterium]|jgi:hypothetical protein|nr:hypothetical protein [Frankiaceae bacterium]MDX6225576.1 hypothetical protein [Frankiales bacterium]MDX6275111.1 hypothetical protein [Frankiales bacterium]